MEGRVLAGRYRLESVVGRGGMGTVWRARDETLDREVAVKEVKLPPGLSDEERENRHRRTLREARAVAQLRHPHVIVVHDIAEQDERPYIVMELIEGGSLAVAQPGGQHDLLDRDLAVEGLVEGAPHRAHAAASDDGFEPVPAGEEAAVHQSSAGLKNR
jgi:hypothetical protein